MQIAGIIAMVNPHQKGNLVAAIVVLGIVLLASYSKTIRAAFFGGPK